MRNIIDYYTKRPDQEGWDFGRAKGVDITEWLRSRINASRTAPRPKTFLDYLRAPKAATAEAATKKPGFPVMPLAPSHGVKAPAPLPRVPSTPKYQAPQYPARVQAAIDKMRGRVNERNRISTERITDPFAASYVPREENLGADYEAPPSLPEVKPEIPQGNAVDYQPPPASLEEHKKGKEGIFARLAKGWESMDEDTRKNLALSALAASLGLMSQQKYTTVPHSPVAEIGEAGLGGLKTFMTLSQADRKDKAARHEMLRKLLRDEQTRQHQERLEGFEEERLGYKRPGGIDYRNTLNQMAARKDTTEVEVFDEETQTYQKKYVPNEMLKYLKPITKPTETVGQKVWNPETGKLEERRIGKYERGSFLQKPDTKIISGAEGEKRTTMAVTPGPGGTYEKTRLMSGTGPSEARATERIRVANAEKYYRNEVKDILSRANIEMTPQEAIEFNKLNADNIGAFFASKTRALSPDKKEAVNKALSDAFARYTKAVASSIGAQARPAPTEEENTDPFGVLR